MSFSKSEKYLKAERCPECAKQGKDTSKDNLQRWQFHAHCFACGYHEFPDGKTRLCQHLHTSDGTCGAKEWINPDTGEIVKDEKPEILELPNDAGKTIDAKALQWLDKYGIMREEIIENDLRWSPFRQWLIFPIRGDTGLIAYQGRNFGPNGPKWESRGNLATLFHIIGEGVFTDQPLVIVEDIVSAIKVGRQFQCTPLFGSYMGLAKLAQMRHVSKKLVWWLDADKYPDSIKQATRARPLGIDSKVVFTQKDPKEYSDEDIKAIITG